MYLIATVASGQTITLTSKTIKSSRKRIVMETLNVKSEISNSDGRFKHFEEAVRFELQLTNNIFILIFLKDVFYRYIQIELKSIKYIVIIP